MEQVSTNHNSKSKAPYNRPYGMTKLLRKCKLWF